MTLISSHNSDGCTGKCDANCYNATSSECDCICGGMNHGVGLKQAGVNTAKHCEEWIKKYAVEKGISEEECRVNLKIYQQQLF